MSANSALVVALGLLLLLGIIGIDSDVREDLDIGEAVVNIVQDLSMKLIEDLQNLLGRVTVVALGNKPSENVCSELETYML